MQRTARAILTALLSCGALVLIALATSGAGSHPSATPSAPAQAGMRAVIDPETGTISGNVPLPELSEADKAALEPQATPEKILLPDGSIMIDLKGTMQEYYVMQIDPKTGKRSEACVTDPNHLPPTPAALEEK